MYTEEYLSAYPYFREVLTENTLANILDSLTGLVSRPFILAFINRLMEDQTPFMLAILDLDNFKHINDKYGHMVGDDTLREVSERLQEFYTGTGVCGRFGGDELLILYFGGNTYDGIHDLFARMYLEDAVLRHKLQRGNVHPFITGTVGSACFPENARDFDTLFSLIDKALYRGKSKGRNCYIIYVEEKHKDIEIHKLAQHDLYAAFCEITQVFESATPDTFRIRMQASFRSVNENLGIARIFYINSDRMLVDAENSRELGMIDDLEERLEGDLYATSYQDSLHELSPSLHAVLSSMEIESVLVLRIRKRDTGYGFLIYAAPRIIRLWQSEDKVSLFYLSHLMADWAEAHEKRIV